MALRTAWLIAACVSGGAGTACADDVTLARGADASTSDAQSLYVAAEVMSVPVDEGSSTFTTTFAVTLVRSGAGVSGSTVTVTGLSTPVALTDRGSGRYTGAESGYAGSYRVDVHTADAVPSVTLAGPLPHTFESPVSDTAYASHTTIPVLWQPFGASEAYIDTIAFPRVDITDTGGYTIPAIAVVGIVGEREDDRVEVCRGARTSVPGANPSSYLHVVFCNQTPFIIDGT